MPNWCSNNITIYTKKADLICEKINEVTKRKDDSDGWIGYLGEHIGRDYAKEGRGLRGWIQDCWVCDYKDGEPTVRVDIETAWSPMPYAVEDFAKYYDPEAEVIYYAEEPGSEVYCTNDPYCDETIIDYVEDESLVPPELSFLVGDNDYPPKAWLYEKLIEALGHLDTLENLVEEANSKCEYNFIHLYEYCPISEL